MPTRPSTRLPGVPVVALTGHLGAGKTTVLNHLLRAPGARVGVVVNDFGAINVDAALVTGQVDEPASITGGCVCCISDTDELDAALERLTHPRLALDVVVVEASGVAEPAALAKLIRYSGVERVRPGGVVDVLDAVEHRRTLDTRDEPPPRHAAASLVVVNKCDLLPPATAEHTLRDLESRVRAVNPHAALVRTSGGRLDPALVFDAAAHEPPDGQLTLADLARPDLDDEHRHEHTHVGSASLAVRSAISPGRLLDLLERPPAGTYRAKGVVSVVSGRGGATRGYLVNLVGRQLHVASHRAPSAPGSELVLLGPGLDVAAAERALAVAMEPADRPDPEGARRLQRYRRLSL